MKSHSLFPLRLLFGGMTTAIQGLQAQLEAETPYVQTALAHVDKALALAHQAEDRCHLAFLHPIRGEILLKRDPSNPGTAEDAFRTALAVASERGARSFGLPAALALARLYHSTGHPSDAHAVLAPALEGLFADARNAGDRRGAGADGAFGVGPLRAGSCPTGAAREGQVRAIVPSTEAVGYDRFTSIVLKNSNFRFDHNSGDRWRPR
jgi:hypothetical protein